MCRTLLLIAAGSFLTQTALAQDFGPLALMTSRSALEFTVPQTEEPVPASTEGVSLTPVRPLVFNSRISVGGQPASDRESLAPLALWEQQVQQDIDKLAGQSPSDFDTLFDSLGNVFDAQDIDGPLGTLSTVHIFAGDANVQHQPLPFISLSQDADELDAHLRLGVGTGAIYRFDSLTSLDAEVVYLQGTGDVNPQTGDETRFVLVFTHRF